MDTKRGAIVVGASVAALVAGFFIRSYWLKKTHEQGLESEEKVRDFDQAIASMNQKKRTVRKSTNGRHRVASN